MAFVDPAAHAYPALQFPLHVSTDKPAVDPKRPAGHGAVHEGDVSPLVFPNRPAAHDVHALWPRTLYVPGRQIDAVALMDPTAHAYPAEQLPLHAGEARPGAAPYRPAAHNVHDAAPARLYLPAAQTDAVALVDPAAQACPAVQLPLHVGDDRPGTAPYRPAAHAAVHAADVSPVPFPNRPGGQSTHSPAPDRLYWPTPHIDAVGLVDPAAHAYPALQFPLHVSIDMPVVDP